MEEVRRLSIITILCVGCLTAANAQTFTQQLQKSKQGEGQVTVTQDKAITDLVDGPQTVTPVQQQQTQPPTRKQTDDKNTATTPNKTDKPDKSEKPDSGATQRPVVKEQSPQLPDSTVDDGRKKVMKGGYKVNGFRVQVYAGGNSRDARIKAERIGREMNALFPGTPIYVHFYSPRWICRMGNYRTHEEANEVLRAVKKLGYSSAIIVKGKITVPYLPSADPVTP